MRLYKTANYFNDFYVDEVDNLRQRVCIDCNPCSKIIDGNHCNKNDLVFNTGVTQPVLQLIDDWKGYQ